MENLVYFPSFEPPTTNWLKFALLYVENFNPIIPDSGRQHLSAEYERVIGDTDLVVPYRPTYDQGDRASVKAIEFLEKINSDPYRYTNIFNRANIVRAIANANERRFKIFGEKFSYTWERYCLDNNFGERTDGGILVTQELGFIYLTFLAEEIAFEEGKSIITDNNAFDNFLNYRRVVPRAIAERQRFTQGVISLTVPKNISEIPIRNLVRFRNDNRERIRAFNLELNAALTNIQNGVDERDFVNRFNNIYSELITEILTQGLGVATIPLGTYLVLKNATALSAEYINQFIGGLGIILTAKVAVSSRWREIVNKHDCKRYITNLERLR